MEKVARGNAWDMLTSDGYGGKSREIVISKWYGTRHPSKVTYCPFTWMARAKKGVKGIHSG